MIKTKEQRIKKIRLHFITADKKENIVRFACLAEVQTKAG
jgi:hypothetical protein